jgi:hypothetical protein
MSNEELEDQEKSPLNVLNLLVSEEKPSFISLMKQIMLLDINLHNKSYMWREHKQLLEAICKTIKLFPIPETSIILHPTLFLYARDGIKPIQYTSLEIIASLILYNYDTEEAESVLKEVINQLAEADSSQKK